MRWAGALSLFAAVPAEVRVEGLSDRPPDRISIFTVRDEGIHTPLIAFQERARQEVEAHLHAQIVSMDEMFTRGDLSFKAMVDCRGDAGCFSKLLGAAVDARYLLVIIASGGDEGGIVGARIVDLEEKKVAGESLAEVPRGGDLVEAVPARIRAAVPAEWWDPFGSLEVDVGEAGAQLAVKGRIIGMSPIGSITYLLPGSYEITATKVGFLPAKVTGVVERGKVSKVSITLEPEPADSTWAIWVGVAAGVVVVGGATALAVVFATRDSEPPSFCTAPSGVGCR